VPALLDGAATVPGRCALVPDPPVGEHGVDMDSDTEPRLPPGHQPYDPLNGVRIGAIAGGLVGVFVAALTGFGGIGTVAAAALVGGGAGYAYQKRERASQQGERGG
jgi:hypothetical protein